LGIHAEELRLALIDEMGGGDDGTHVVFGETDPVTVVPLFVDAIAHTHVGIGH
jgi:hypothetical protein